MGIPMPPKHNNKQAGELAMADDSNRIENPDFLRVSAQTRFPPINQAAFFRAFERNMSALSDAAQIAFQGTQAVAQRQMEFVQQTMSDLTEGIQGASAADARQGTEPFRRAYERAVANGRELFDLVRHC